MTDALLQPEACACFNLRRAARQVTQAYDRALRPAGIQATQFSLLAMLDGSDGGSDNGAGVGMGDLAGRLGMDRTTLTRNLALVERSGWVAVAEGADRRERRVSLTAAGRDVLQAAMPLWRSAQERVLAQLGSAGLTDLLALSGRLGGSARTS